MININKITDTTNKNMENILSPIDIEKYIEYAKENQKEQWMREDAIRKEVQMREDNAWSRAVEDAIRSGINPNLVNIGPAESGGGITNATGIDNSMASNAITANTSKENTLINAELQKELTNLNYDLQIRLQGLNANLQKYITKYNGNIQKAIEELQVTNEKEINEILRNYEEELLKIAKMIDQDFEEGENSKDRWVQVISVMATFVGRLLGGR